MRHRANPRFWACYRQLPDEIRRSADESYRRVQRDPQHPSLRFKTIGRFWSVRVGLHYRALAVEHENEMVRFRIVAHAVYNRLVSGRMSG